MQHLPSGKILSINPAANSSPSLSGIPLITVPYKIFGSIPFGPVSIILY
jgi:hypothetical protein